VEDSLRRQRLSLAAALAVATSAAVVATPLAASAAPADDIPVQLVAMNDFHGRISETTSGDATLVDDNGVTQTVGGSAHVSATVQNLQSSFTSANGGSEDTYFVGAGDWISASPFESSVFKDEPTIEVLNAMGLDVSSVGNHEFDRGTDGLRRISAATDDYEATHGGTVGACDGVTPNVDGCWTDSAGDTFHGTDFPYLAANVVDKTTRQPILPPYQVLDVAGGKKVALIGVVTKTTPTLVSPDGIADVDFLDEATAVNTYVPELQAQGIQAIGVLIHEGGQQNGGADVTQPNDCTDLTGPIVGINNRIDPAVDLIVSAHSHQQYNCTLPVPGGEPRLVTQAGYYGRLVTDIRLSLDPDTGDVDRAATYSATNVPVLRTVTDARVQAIVDYWVARSAESGAQVVGSTTGPINRAKNTAGDAIRDRESPLGDLVAQMQLQAMQQDQFGHPVIAFMNPGGLRTDIPGPGDVTYRQLFDVQPFGNTVNALTLTGADIRQVLEEQFGLDQARGTQLFLGTSEGLTYNFDPTRTYGDRVDPLSIKLNGTLIDPAAQYRVVANSFLVAGGDGFTGFTHGTDPVTGPVDVDTAVTYFQSHSPVAPPAGNHATQTPDRITTTSASISNATPTRGTQVTVTGAGFAADEQVTATLENGRRVGTATVDPSGAVTVSFRVPVDLAQGAHTVTLTSASGQTASTGFTLAPVATDVRTVIEQVISAILAWLFHH
jgi:5'-nucleotidase